MYDPKVKIQLIIPVYNDREAVERLLPKLIEQDWSPSRITVVDASDNNPLPIQNDWGIHLLHPLKEQKGRAAQMNLGAEQSESDALLFLHADTLLPAEAQHLISKVLSQGKVGGCFSRRFDSPSRFLRFTCVLADLRATFLGWYFGDQAIFCSREVFERLGGFPNLSSFEDLEFSRRLQKTGSCIVLKPGVLSSARRFKQEGPFRRTCKDLRLTLSYFFKP